jgi:hypothetical protein
MREAARHPVGVRWCFHCRARRHFDHVIHQPTNPDSYYGPRASIECAWCHTTDSDLFPGRYREWEEP